MPIEPGTGNLLKAHVDALVNTVNTQGIMGKGLALQFKKAFPEAFRDYDRACKAGEIVPGKVHVVHRLMAPRFIINFPTKKHWRHPSKLDYIREGLEDLARQILALGIRSIAVPPLGCGHGGLRWEDVRPLIESALAPLADVRVLLYAPQGAPAADEVIDRRSKPKMTGSRAAVLAAMGKYLATGYEYRLSLLEVQKLAYFLQATGEPLRLEFKPHHYGPYADNLRKALRNIEGHYTQGLGDGENKPETPLQLLPDALDKAEAFLAGEPESEERLAKVATLIDGFETPFGMELLATTHWVAHHQDAPSLASVIAGVHAWSERKRSQMKHGHIQAAWMRLADLGWVKSSA